VWHFVNKTGQGQGFTITSLWSSLWKDKVSNAEVLARTGQRRLQDIIGEMEIPVRRMVPERPARRAIIEWTPGDGSRKRGRPRKTWRSTFREDLQARGVSWSEKETMAAYGVRWRNLLPILFHKGPEDLSAKC